MTGKEIIKVSSEAQVIEKLAELVEKYAQEAIAGKSSFSIGLSGGSLVKYLAAGLPHIQNRLKNLQVSKDSQAALERMQR
uniref:Glucosamine/galactosamine-6-phosphate isomerase domain-containing protein n=1 Tax=Lutzomyia longipalpis TaxID=7200 RepID=A0A1B0GKZ0_LUTLO